jgi:hypothetical protein
MPARGNARRRRLYRDRSGHRRADDHAVHRLSCRKATLAATIIVAVLSLVDFSIFRTAWVYSKADFVAVAATVLVTLVIGVEAGVTAGVSPVGADPPLQDIQAAHGAVMGLVPGTEHYRNVKRHEVITDPHILQLARRREPLFRQCAVIWKTSSTPWLPTIPSSSMSSLPVPR